MKHLVLLVAALWLASACSSPEAPTPEPDPDAGCGDCATELAALEASLAELPSVTAVRRVVHQRRTPTNSDTVSVELEVDGADLDTLQDEVVRLVWVSEVTPVSWVDVAVKRADGSIEALGPFNLTGDGDGVEYEERWGPRPVS
ncbi:MAG: hypothetical protein ACI379_16530 [Nocardioides sp.]|uniref:hypothetical protein n=1 Tax=Nocardioides sp. TaxID=35761 RepID=UPI003F0FD0DE